MTEEDNEKQEPQAQQPTKRRQQGRSPSYPGIDLERALTLARAAYVKEQHHEASVDTIWHDWGMRPKTGPALVSIAALKKFGLFDGAGGKVRLSNLALSIIRDPREESPEREERIREAALKPPVHTELWEKYKGKLPSDGNIKWYLTNERGFTDRGADELIQQFRRTISFAGLQPPDLQSTTEGDKLNGGEGKQMEPRTGNTLPPPPPPSGGPPLVMREFPLPISHDACVLLKGPFPLTEEEWAQMEAVLNAMKPVLKKEASKTEPAPLPKEP